MDDLEILYWSGSNYVKHGDTSSENEIFIHDEFSANAEFIGEIELGEYVTEYYYFREKPHFFKLNKERKEILECGQAPYRDIFRIIQLRFPEYWSDNVNVNDKKYYSIDDKFNPLNNNYYRQHLLYVDVSYDKIFEILYESLKDKSLLVEDGTYLKKFPDWGLEQLKERQDNNGFSIELYQFHIKYDEGYSGLLISVQNYPERIAQRINLQYPLYKSVLSRFNNVPIPIIFNYPRRGYYHGSIVYDRYIIPLVKQLDDNGANCWIHSTDNQVIFIKNNPLLSLEEKIELLHRNNEYYFEKKYREEQSEVLKHLFGDYWNLLSKKSREMLITSFSLYKFFKKIEDISDESSPASIEFSKCVETELAEKLLKPFKKFYNNSEFKEMDLSSDIKDRDLSSMARYIKEIDAKTPELGTFAYYLSVFIHSKKRAKNSAVLQAFKEFVSQLPRPEFVTDKNILLDTLTRITTKYRNGAAHTELLPFKVLDEFYQLLIGTGQNGFIFKMLDSLVGKTDESSR